MAGDTRRGSNIDTKNAAVACGVAVVVTHRHKILFGKRKSRENTFEWQLPGGWIDRGQSPEQAARREVCEETGLQLQEVRFVGITNNIFTAHKHSLSLYFEAECADVRSLIVGEDSKCIAWEWRNWADLTEPLYLPLRLFRKTGYQPFLSDRQQTYASF
jgi:8-oxo-dGTP diphosphatase